MANQQEQLKQAFSETEFCLRKYFSENFSPIIARQSAELHKKQEKELQDYINKNQRAICNSPNGSMLQVNVDLLHRDGTWSTKTTEDLLEYCRKEFMSNGQIRKDMETMSSYYRYLLVQSMGEKKYQEMSRGVPTGDLAMQYVATRFDEMFIEHLAKKGVPRSSLEYVLKEGFNNSLLGILVKVGSHAPSSLTDEKVRRRMEEIYHPSTAEKFAARGVSFAIDAASTRGIGSVKSVIRAGVQEVALGVGGAQLEKKAVEKKIIVLPDPREFSKQMGKAVFGDDKAFLDIQAKARKVSPARSAIVGDMNGNLSRKMKLPAYSAPYSPTAELNARKLFTTAHSTTGKSMLDLVNSAFKASGIAVTRNTPVPQWMIKLGHDECNRLSANFAAKACEMAETKKQVLTIQGKKYTYKEVCQRAYDYARAARTFESRTPSAAPTQYQQTTYYSKATPNMAASAQAGAVQTSSMQNYQNYQQQSIPGQQPATVASQVNDMLTQRSQLDGWQGLMSQFGLSAFAGIPKNIGYVFAMLPDLIAGMFTGKTRNLKFSDNLMPIAAILFGLFTKSNPLLKMILVGFGGISLLKKASAEVQGSQAQGTERRVYKTFPDEPLDPRMSKVAMKGNTMVCNIDGKPLVITISDIAVDAYYKNKVPLNTLANHVLAKYDEQQNALSNSYEQDLAVSQDQQRTVGIK